MLRVWDVRCGVSGLRIRAWAGLQNSAELGSALGLVGMPKRIRFVLSFPIL